MTTKVKEILNEFNPYILYVEMGGSRGLPFIRHPSDYDIIVVCKDATSRNECVHLFRQKYNIKDLRKEYNLDFHFILDEWKDNFIMNHIYPYIVSHTDIIYKTIEDYLPKNKTLEYVLSRENIVMEKYKLKIQDERLMNGDNKYLHKTWYYMYATLCMYKNKSYELTEEQIENINILHDRKEEDKEKRIKLIDNIVEEIDSWHF